MNGTTMNNGIMPYWYIIAYGSPVFWYTMDDGSNPGMLSDLQLYKINIILRRY